MSHKNRTAQGAQGGNAAAGQGVGKKGAARQGYENWKSYKKANVERDDVDIISRSTLDTSDYVSLLNVHDRLLHKLRMNMGRKKNLTMAAVGNFIELSDAI